MRFIGRRDEASDELGALMDWAESLTRANRRITLCVAFNYGGRAEILDAVKRFQGGTEEDLRRCLYAPELHDPDVIIRTGGEQRLSNYLLWQAAYSELVFRQEMWPDFSRQAFHESLSVFGDRSRRFGGRALRRCPHRALNTTAASNSSAARRAPRATPSRCASACVPT